MSSQLDGKLAFAQSTKAGNGKLMRNHGIRYRFGWLGCAVWLGLVSFELGIAPFETQSAKSSQKKNGAPADQYVGSQACSACHKEIYAEYLRTGMGRSVVRVTPEWVNGHRISGSVEDKNNQL